MSEAFHGQSTKEMYRCDIEDSIKQKTVYKLYEYLDDHSYCDSENIGVWIRPHTIKCRDNATREYIDHHNFQMILFQEDGPTSDTALRKLLEWRRSGDSDEIGHKGGGNKRLIYGMNATKVTIYMKPDEHVVLKCETKPKAIYELSVGDKCEDEFHSLVDTSQYVKTPEEIPFDELPNSYRDLYHTISSDSDFEPNYLMIVEMDELPSEFNNRGLWDEFIHQVRAKQYDIPIHFKNEVLDMNMYETYEPIDTVGLHGPEPNSMKHLDLYIDKSCKKFFIQINEKRYDVRTGVEMDPSSDMLLWGTVSAFLVEEEYFKQQYDEYNLGLDRIHRAKQEDFYGVYFMLNGKLTNYLPIKESSIVQSKNNKISSGNHQSCNRFRLLIQPNNEVCGESKYFNSLIRTETIKALSGFLDSSPYKYIIKQSMEIYRNNTVTQKRVKKASISPNLRGGVYLLYFGYGLWKFGKVSQYSRIDTRIKQHIAKKKDYLVEFKILDDDSVTKVVPNVATFYKEETAKPAGAEEDIESIVKELQETENKKEEYKIVTYASRGDNTKIREFFKCDDTDLVMNQLIPLINDKIDSVC